MGKYDRTEEQDMQIVLRVQEPVERCGVKMQKNILKKDRTSILFVE